MVKPLRRLDPVNARIDRNLRILRQQKHISLDEFGRRLGVTYPQIQTYETGANRISASTLYRIIGILGCKVDDLFEGLASILALNGHAHANEGELVVMDEAIRPAQVRAARGLLNRTEHKLCRASGVSALALRQFERGMTSLSFTELVELRAALHMAGVEFIPANGGGGGIGSR